MQTATLTEKLGALEPQISERDDIIKSLEAEKLSLAAELETAKAEGTPGDTKANARLERQTKLAQKEVEYLRAQIKGVDAEESTMELQSYDAAKAERIKQLEDLVTSYSAEVQTLQAELAAQPKSADASGPVTRKRSREDDGSADSEQLGTLTRKNRKLQAELSDLKKNLKVAEKEIEATKKQLKAAKASKSTRILEFRDNPTAQAEAIKMSTLESLRKENEALLHQLADSVGGFSALTHVPRQTLEAAKRETEDVRAKLVSSTKSIDRLKKVWASKTAEFREAISSLLGWKVEFLPNGKMKVESLFYPSVLDADGNPEEERSIVFDGDRGTMKVSGGPRSRFAERIRESIAFWVRDRGEIPCLLAALTLEFYEERQQEKGV
jgi:mitotic spindle assembly checkpoint protein MAD1